MNKKQKGSLFIIILYIFLTLFPSISSAHAYIVESSPSENEILKNSPKEVTIQFDETIQAKFNSIEVTNSKGNRVDKKNGAVDPSKTSVLKVGIKGNLPDGTYRVQWKVVSNDGHPVQGVIPFQIGAANDSKSASVTNESTGYYPKADLVIIRWLQYCSNACFVGLLFFYLIILPKELVQFGSIEKNIFKLMWAGFFFLAVSILLSLPLQATIVLGLKWSEVLSIDALGQVLAYTVYGKMWLIQIAILFSIALTTHFLSKAESTKSLLSWISLTLGIGLLLTKSLTSHAAAQANQLVTVSMDFLHLLTASVWIGSLLGIAVLLPLRNNTDMKKFYLGTLQRFSKWGVILVLLIAATGLMNGFQYIPTVSSLFQTAYGKTLICKIILFFCMLIFAFFNFQKGKKANEKGLATSLWGELIIGFIILLLTVFLTNLPTAMSSPGPINDTNTVNQGKKITLKVTPNVIGENTYLVTMKDKSGHPLKKVEQITLTFKHTEMNMGKDSITLSKVSEGKYEAKGLNLNMAGKWNFHVHVLTKELESIDTDFRCLVGSN